MIKAVCFDFDGVIVESVDIKTEAFREMFKDESDKNVQRIIEYHKKHGGINRKNKIIHFYSNVLKRELTENHLNEMLRMFSEFVKDKVINSAYVKGAREFIEKNHKKYVFYIVSGTPQEELNEIVLKKGLNSYFKKICGFPPAKTELLSELIKSENFDKNKTVFIGDSIDDMLSAKYNCVRFIGRSIFGLESEDFHSKQFSVVEDLLSLEDIIASM